jgi:integrase/recombinase XerD
MSKTIIFDTEATGIKRLVLIEVANSLAQTFALLYKSAGIEGASSHSGRRTFLTSLANRGTAIHILKTLAGHRSISTTAAYLYSSPSQLKAAVELV